MGSKFLVLALVFLCSFGAPNLSENTAFQPLIHVQPVEISQSAAGNNVLTWTLSPESPADRFLVQRSANGRQFRAIGHVTVKPGDRQCRFEDKKTQGTTWYRILRIAPDGSVDYSDPVSTAQPGLPATKVSQL